VAALRRSTRPKTGIRSRSRATVDIVLPVFNEIEGFESTYRTISKVIASLPQRFKIVCVDDGSTDGTPELLRKLALRDRRLMVLELSRNFGHQAALTAGLASSQADIAITMDADGQHPADLIPEMIDLIGRGYDVVQGQRVESASSAVLKRWTSGWFYRLLNAISGTRVLPGAADFRALSRQAIDALNSMPEYHRFLRGMISWMGFKTVILPYTEPKRTAGRSKYSAAKMLRLALDAVFSFSLAPLYVGLSFGGVLFCLAIAEMTYVLSFWVTGRSSGLAPGWSSLMFIVLIVGAMLMLLLGFVGVYVGYIFQEVKRRPVFLAKEDRMPDKSWTHRG